MSALNCMNYDISKKLNEMSFKSFVKEERKNKTPIKKIPINNFSLASLRNDLSYDCAHKKLMKKKIKMILKIKYIIILILKKINK